MTDEHEVWDELAAGAALHALEPDEQQLFDLHAADCARCRTALDENSLIAAQLGTLSVGSDEDVEPPSWSSIRAGIVSSPAPVTDELAARRRDRAKLSNARRALAAAAAVVAIAGGGIAGWRLSAGGPAGPCDGVTACHVVSIHAAGGASLQLVVQGDRVTMRGSDMPAAPPAKTYVLWQEPRVGKATAVASYSGRGTATAQLPLAYRNTGAFAISEEPAGPLPAQPSDVLATEGLPEQA